MELLRNVCSDDVAIVEDAAHAHGEVWNGRSSGSFGQMAAFSFQNFKLMTAGEGGFLLVNEAGLIDQARRIANCGRRPGDPSYDHSVLGSNYRLSEFQAAVLNAQLSRLDELAERRLSNATRLDELVGQVSGVTPQSRDPRTDRHSFYMYVVSYDSSRFGGLGRDDFVRALVAEGVPAYRMYPRVQDTGFFPPSMHDVAPVRRASPLARSACTLPKLGSGSITARCSATNEI